LVKHNSNPIFNAYRNFHCIPGADDFMFVEVYDQDLTRDDSLASLEIPLASLSESPSTHNFNLKGHPKFTITLRRACTSGPVPTRKSVFFLRHGESIWNVAQRERDLATMASFDHALTARGVMQALRLNRRWRRALPDQFSGSDNASEGPSYPEDEPYLALLAKIDFIASSPLTRAVQTALCGAWGHKKLESGLTLRAGLREVKNVGGLDTVGRVVGEKIKPRAVSELVTVWSGVDVDGCEAVEEGNHDDEVLAESAAAEAEAEAAAAADDDVPSPKTVDGVSPSPEIPEDSPLATIVAPALLHDDAATPWWTPARTFDSRAAVDERLADVLNWLRYGDAQTPLLVGHSLLWRSLYSRVCPAGAELRERKPELCARLAKDKLDNGVMICLDIDFEKMELADAHIMFGGGFHA
jgi:broad specificity phosphatase PhoE